MLVPHGLASWHARISPARAPVHLACNDMHIYAIALTSMQFILFALHVGACIGPHVLAGAWLAMPAIAAK